MKVGSSLETWCHNTNLSKTELYFLQIAERLDAFQASGARSQNYVAMYSSIFGGITTDPSAMVIPIDDHMVHRGHGVFDTAAIMDG